MIVVVVCSYRNRIRIRIQATAATTTSARTNLLTISKLSTLFRLAISLQIVHTANVIARRLWLRLAITDDLHQFG